MKVKTFLVSTIIIIFGLFIIANTSYSKSKNTIKSKNSFSMTDNLNESKADQLRIGMRKLWQEHVQWTRNVILNITDGLPGEDQAVNRLLKNQDDIGNAIKQYYGNDAGNKLTALLKAHINEAADVVTAAKKGNKAALDDANTKWHNNANEIASFLSSANPNWELSDMKNMMNNHLQYTTDEAVARIKKDYKADVADYDKVEKEILSMSDMLSDGIIKQFPDKFKM